MATDKFTYRLRRQFEKQRALARRKAIEAARRLRGDQSKAERADVIRQVEVIAASGLFDLRHYFKRYPDTIAFDDPIRHFVMHGAEEGRWPNPEFDPHFYRNFYDDVGALNPLIHYIEVGFAEERLTREPPEDEEREITDAPRRGSDWYRPGAKTSHHEPARPVSGDTVADAFAFYLPQFHPIPENDEWWGKGFTEWHNVAKAEPQFSGHIQPRLPADLGFYDLRLPDVMAEQADLARTFGIKGFCFYYYWFGGHRLLEKPVDLLLEHRDIDLPFFLAWANENWSRRWDGSESQVLMAQNHSAEDDLGIIADLARYMADPRYHRVDGKPVILIYRPEILPEAAKTLERWRTWCRENGIGDILVGGIMTFGFEDLKPLGFDFAVEFPPHNLSNLHHVRDRTDVSESFVGHIFDYESYAAEARAKAFDPKLPVVRGVMPSWDNTARRGPRANIFHGATPQSYQRLLAEFATEAKAITPTSRPMIMINAWNEWAEGTVLEPDRAYGHAFINATARALRGMPFGRLLVPATNLERIEGAECTLYRPGSDVIETVFGLEAQLAAHDAVLIGDATDLTPEDVAVAAQYLLDHPACGATVVGHRDLDGAGMLDSTLVREFCKFANIAADKVPDSALPAVNPAAPVLVRSTVFSTLNALGKDTKSGLLETARKRTFANSMLPLLCRLVGFSLASSQPGAK